MLRFSLPFLLLCLSSGRGFAQEDSPCVEPSLREQLEQLAGCTETYHSLTGQWSLRQVYYPSGYLALEEVVCLFSTTDTLRYWDALTDELILEISASVQLVPCGPYQLYADHSGPEVLEANSLDLSPFQHLWLGETP